MDSKKKEILSSKKNKIKSIRCSHNNCRIKLGILGFDCKCGLKGKYFLVHGRVKESEVRGCSDVG